MSALRSAGSAGKSSQNETPPIDHSGVYICVSHAQPSYRLTYLQRWALWPFCIMSWFLCGKRNERGATARVRLVLLPLVFNSRTFLNPFRRNIIFFSDPRVSTWKNLFWWSFSPRTPTSLHQLPQTRIRMECRCAHSRKADYGSRIGATRR